ncbi:MAG: tRNA lysidine(34) synthetase TilS [Dehalococcoidales bacterium]|nr:tRNA lysidine(34) synthetase TilS [Dehalococcoidales bacterium]
MSAAAKRKEPPAERVLGFIREHCPPAPKSCLVVAVSGGPDSVCLLHILNGLKETLGIELHAAHLNHQLRGAEAEADAEYVANLAQSLGIPLTVEKGEVKEYQAQRRISLEEAAREVRYRFLAQTASSLGAGEVAVGHTRDDNIETILMHLIRGSGTRGLKGLCPRSQWPAADTNLTIIRPLLGMSREETQDYCREHDLNPRLDASNLSLSPLRNRIRLKLLPQLKGYNPRIVEALLRTARLTADDLAFLEAEGVRAWNQIARLEKDTVILDKERLLALPPAMKRQVLRLSLDKLIGSLKDIEARHIEEVMNALDKPAGRSLNLPGGLTFIIEYQRYLLGKEPPAPQPPLAAELPLNIPGETRLPGWRVTASVTEQTPPMEDDDDLSACFDLAKTGDRLSVRERRPGDRFQPLGMNQPKKLNRFMIDAKIPRSRRRNVPVVASPSQIVWVVGGRIDDRVKVTGETRRVLQLRFTPD